MHRSTKDTGYQAMLYVYYTHKTNVYAYIFA